MNPLLHVIPEWLGLVALACCIGVPVHSLWVVGHPRTSAPGDEEALLTGASRLLGIAAAILFASTILTLGVRAAEMSDRPIAEVVPVLPTVLLRTHFGRAWMLRIAAILALSVTSISGRRSLRSRLLGGLMLGCALLVSATNSASGHASDAGDFSVLEIMDWLHLLPALVWAGELVVLGLLVLPRLVKQGDRGSGSMARIATRFSGVAGIGVVLLLLTAPYQAWAYVGSIGPLARSSYGRIVVIKIGLFSLLLLLGACNRFISVPRIQEWAGATTSRRGALGRVVSAMLSPVARAAGGPAAGRWFTLTVNVEASLLVVVLLCTAILRQGIPPRHDAHLKHQATVGSGVVAPRAY